MNPTNYQLPTFVLARVWLNMLRNLVILVSIISPVTFAASAFQIEKNYAIFDLNLDARQQIISANFFSDFDLVTTVAANTGQLVIQQQDFVIPFRGFFQLPMYRQYSRDFKQLPSIAPGWRWAFDLRINKINDDYLELTDFDGLVYEFKQRSNNRFENISAPQKVVLKTATGYSYKHQQNDYRFNDDGYLLDITDPSENVISFGYQNHRLENITLYDWATIEFKYDTKNRLIEIKLPSGKFVNYRYNGESLSDVFDQYNNHISYEYADNNLEKIKHAAKTILEVSEDIQQGKRDIVLKTQDSYELFYRHQIHDAGQFNLTVSKVSAAQSVSLLYACVNQACSIKDYSGATATINWHEKYTNLPILYRSAEGRETQWQYNEQAKLILKRAADKSITRYEYDDRQWLKSEISARGTITNYEYTDEGLVSLISRSDVQAYIVSYNENGLIKSIRRPNGKVITIEYNANALPVVLRFDLATLYLHYDAYYRNTQVDIDNVPTLQIVYNNADRSVLSENLLTKKIQQLTYSNSGLPIAISKQDTGNLKLEYDANNNLVFIKSLNKNLYSFTYDHFDRLDNITSLARVSQNFSYDALSRLTHVSNESDAVIKRYSYNNDGLITKEESIDTAKIAYSYDAKGRLSEVFAGDLPLLQVDYNADDYPVLLNRSGHEIKYLRDSLNRIKLMRIKTKPDADYRDYEFVWNDANQLSELHYPSGTSVSYDYDAFGRMRNLSLNQNSIIRLQYEGVGRLRLNSVAGVSTKINKNLLNQFSSLEIENNNSILKKQNHFNAEAQLTTSVTKINAKKLMQTDLAATIKAAALKQNSKPKIYYALQSTYNHNSESNSLEILDQIPIELVNDEGNQKDNNIIRYSFDEFDRIKSIAHSSLGVTQYNYQFNRLVNAGDRLFSYDQSNRLIKISTSEINQDISYNTFNQINKIETEQGAANYSYDGYAKLSNIRETDGDVLIYNYENNRLSEYSYNSKQRDYIYSPDFSSLLAFVDTVPNQDNTDLNSLFFIHANKQASPVLITNGNGDVKNIYQYDPFGNINYVAESVINNIGYRSNFYDQTSGLYTIAGDLSSTLYSAKDAWLFNTSIDVLELSKNINNNKFQSVSPVSSLLISSCLGKKIK